MSNRNDIYRRAGVQPRPVKPAEGEPGTLLQQSVAVGLFCIGPVSSIDKEVTWQNSLREAKRYGGLTR